MTVPDGHPNGTPSSSLQLIYALNAIATALQGSIKNEENVFAIFEEQVIALGLRGGISELDETRQMLNFKTVAFTSPLRRILSRFEKRLNLSTRGYSVPVNRVDVYQRVAHQGQAVFVPDTSVVSSQVIPSGIKALVRPLLFFLGSPPGIFAPLVYDGEVRGMLNMVGASLTEADVPTMQAFANQIAVALENARLLKELNFANAALETAYQKTLEGWVQALDLRDNETEGHTIRVSNATVTLAKFMGMDEKDLTPIYQGALLHDIGKMAISDAILRKPASLTEEEWVIMRQHPLMAYQWLKSIDYLQKAVCVPYCHHERWDGSGYVQGLAGEDIPKFARIFAIVDVWDAMRSDRPYRKALSRKVAFDYITEQSGRHFDPRVVEAFMDLLSQTPDFDAAYTQ